MSPYCTGLGFLSQTSQKKENDLMNCPEKIAGTYLRLNGFFLLPHFTLFDGNEHTHVDFLALRPPRGIERCRGHELLLDTDFFFQEVNRLIGDNPFDHLIGAIVEVKGGQVGELPSERQAAYANNFFGPRATIVKLSFSQAIANIGIRDDTIVISLNHSFDWIKRRINWMNANIDRLTKTGSWAWSEEFLSDLLYLHRLG